MDTLKILGFEVVQTLYETTDILICRVKNNEDKTVLTKSLKTDHPSEEQQEHLKYEYKLLDEDGIGGKLKVRELVKNYMGHVIVMEDEGGIALTAAPVFDNIRKGNKDLSKETIQWIITIFINMVVCLERVHAKNYIHNGINPANFILFQETNQVAILDFGKISKPGKFKRVTPYNMMTDGLAYISPEQTGRMNRALDHRTDFYSLGASMYKLLTGQSPFAVTEALELIHSHMAVVPESPHSVNRNIPEMISAIIMKLMSKESELRYQNAESISYDLKRCRDMLFTTDYIEKFELGLRTVEPRFRVLDGLYGRDEEKKKLRSYYNNIAKGGKGLLLITGESGVGKTALVEDVCCPLAEESGFFTRGKAEQFQMNVPYFVVTQIVRALTESLLLESELKLMQWSDCLRSALSGNGQIMTNMVPELKAIIGEQPSLGELGPAENQNRFFRTLSDFLSVFMRKDNPLIILIDDLQWLDVPSMKFINYLNTRDDLNYCMIVGCYRNTELDKGSSLYEEFAEMQSSGEMISITLNPLNESSVIDMLVDSLHQPSEEVRELAGIVYKKTNGNPFFVKKMLYFLYDKKIIYFDVDHLEWGWNVQRAKLIEISDNIIEFMVSQLRSLPAKTQGTLKIAATLGRKFELRQLSDVSNIPKAEVYDHLGEAIDKEIIMLDDSQENSMEAAPSNGMLHFAHDRIQQACMELMDIEEQKKMHLKIGNHIKESVAQEEWLHKAMVIVSHLNMCIDKIDSEEGLWDVALLNLYACQKAKSSSAFYPALEYVENSVNALPANAWMMNYELTFEIIKNYVECAYLNGRYTLAEEQTQVLLDHTKTSEEKAEVRWMQSSLNNFQGQLDKAIENAVLGLRIIKVHVPIGPGMHLLLKDLVAIKLALIGMDKEKLLGLPPMNNDKVALIAHLWNEINRAAYLVGNTNLFLLSILKQMRLTLQYGSSKGAGKTYISYAMVLAIMGNYRGCDEFCEIARLSCEKEKSLESRPTIYFSSGFFGHAWNCSWKDIEQWFESSMEEAIRFGDQHTIALAGPFMYAFKPDISIRLLIEKSMKHFSLVKQTGNILAFNFMFLMIHRWLNYAGLTDHLFSMSVSSETHVKNRGIGIVYSEKDCLAALKAGDFQSALGVYYKEKTYIHYFYEDYKGALKYLRESEKYMKYHTGTPYMVECTMCSFLVMAANIEQMDNQEHRMAHKKMRRDYRQMKKWAKNCPVNFLHLQYLMEAEMERLKEKLYDALKRYDIAIETARKNGFIRDEALANELAAKMFLGFGKERQGRYYLEESYKIYRFWGAKAKVTHMEEKYGSLLKVKRDSTASDGSITINETLDMLSLVKTTKIISEEAEFPALLQQILKTIIENSGAQKAVILTKSEKDWRIEAEWKLGYESPRLLIHLTLEEANHIIPTSVLRYCIRAVENLVLPDALNSGNYSKDQYITQNQIRSLLCMPILNRGELEGVLYLENNLMTDVFTKERVKLLEILVLQFIISIKNVRLFSDLLAKTEEVHRAEEEVLRSDIAFLQAQIKPHFLYNAINTISAFSLDDSQMARDLLARLSQYLRGSFDFKNRDKLVTLRKELELVEAYLFIEKARFGERLQVVYHIDEEVDCLLPPLVIQPLVENAVLHGLSEIKKGGMVEITVRDRQDHVLICVEDNGIGINEKLIPQLMYKNSENIGGVALKNIQRRLTSLYGQGLAIENKPNGGTRVVIRITK